jgi:hypothetical protein
MNDRLPALIFGGALILVGSGLLWYQWRAGQPDRTDLNLDPFDRRYLATRHRRRLQVAGLILLIGIMIPLGDAIPWQQAAATFAIYWLIVLALGFWTMLLAIGDMVSTRLHTQVSLKRLHSRQQDLEETARRLHSAREQEQRSRQSEQLFE